MYRKTWNTPFVLFGCLLTFFSAFPVSVETRVHLFASPDVTTDQDTHDLPTGKERDIARVNQLTDRIHRAARFILAQQDEQGALNESGYINTDSNMLYAMMGLLAAYDLTKRPEYLAAVEKGCRWLIKVQNPEGDWFLSYRRENDGYLPVLPKSYSSFAAIRAVDTTMALFIHVARQLGERTADDMLRMQLERSCRRAYYFLLAYNLDPQDGLFYSSYQLEKKANHTAATPLSAYKRYRVKYAADNAETYVGLMAAADMFADNTARRHAARLKKAFSRFWDEKSGSIAVMLDEDGDRKMRPAYARYFATGWSAYLMGDHARFAQSLAKIGDDMKADGSFSRWEGTYTLSTLSFLLGESGKRFRSPKTRQAEAFLFSQQLANGGIADDPESRNTYVNIAGMFLLYLAEQAKLDKAAGSLHSH